MFVDCLTIEDESTLFIWNMVTAWAVIVVSSQKACMLRKFCVYQIIINMHHTEKVGSSDVSDFYLGVASAGTLIPQLMRSIIFSVLPGSCATIVLVFNNECFLHSSVVSLAFHFI